MSSDTKEIILADHKSCTGCGACDNACKFSALDMIADDEGFMRPIIDQDKCTHCTACMKACPIITPIDKCNSAEPDIYAVKAKDDVRKIASSGGVFPLLARWILSRGGYVAGAVYDDKQYVHHIVSNKQEDILAMSSSKYVQSDMQQAMSKTLQLLKNGTDVLFSGTPCQIGGIKALVKNKKLSGTLYTMDFFCHGVPSPKFFKKYINELSDGKKMNKYDFRDKSVYGWSTCANAYYDDGTEHHEREFTDPYYRLFLPCAMQRRSCSDCQFSSIPRVADISVGDFWGCEKYKKTLNDGKGTSFALVNSELGKEMFETIRDEFQEVEYNVPLDAILPINPTPIRSFTPHPGRRHAFELLNNTTSDMRKIATHALEFKYDVGLVGEWYDRSYGEALRSYALYSFLMENGYDALLIDKANRYLDDSFYDDNSTIRKFIKERCMTANRRGEDWQYGEYNDSCDMFITAYDNTYAKRDRKGFPVSLYSLDFADPTKKKISYSRSDSVKVSNLISNIDMFDCRPDDKDVDSVDPIYLMNNEFWDTLAAQKPSEDVEEQETKQAGYILFDTVVPGPRKKNIIENISKTMNCDYITVREPNANINTYKDENISNIKDMSVESWIYHIKSAKLVVTDIVDTVIMATMFNVPVIYMKTDSENTQQTLKNVLYKNDDNVVDITLNADDDVICKAAETMKNYDIKQEAVDDNVVADKIQKTKEWLLDCLTQEKEHNSSDIALADSLREQRKMRLQNAMLEDKINQQQRQLEELSRQIKDQHSTVYKGLRYLKHNGIIETIKRTKEFLFH